jgi:hypothetical protein
VRFNGEYQVNGPFIQAINSASYGLKTLNFNTKRSANDYTTLPTTTLSLYTNGNVNVASGALEIGGTTVIDSGRNINAKRLVLTDDGSTSPILTIQADDAAPWALQLYRKDLSGGPVVFASDASTFSWNGNMEVRASFALKMGTTTVIDTNRNISAGTIDSGAIVSTGKVEGSYLQIAGSAQVSRNPGSTNGSLWLAAISSGNGGANTVSISGGASSYAVFNSDGTKISQGGLTVGNQEVITSGRNLTNVGTIDSGAITSSGSVQIGASANLTWGGAYGSGKPTIAANTTTIYFYPTGNVSGARLYLNATGLYNSGVLTLSADTTDVLDFSANSTTDARGISFNNRTA